ncbi:MAG TPA: CHAT domain-containing tetratricopeptide repeat protein [Thermoanaerobaculia bacterium]|nr:CHAT domain-containing tetratricopeptide repeat protein [Thermoanaerobaculia bacterium]
MIVGQTGVDVAVRLVGPLGEEIATADGVGGRKEPELLSWIASTDGDFRLLVTPREPAGAGPYKVTLEELRSSTKGDAERVAAERTTSEADHWLAREDADAKREALTRYEKGLALWQSVGDRRREVKALNQIGLIHRRLGETEKALSLYERALALAREAGDLAGEAETRNNLGVARYQGGQSQMAIQDLQESLRLWEELGETDQIASTAYSLGAVQYSFSDLEGALASYERARGMGSMGTQAQILAGIASVFRDRGDVDSALGLYAQALDLSRKANHQTSEASILQNLGNSYLRQGELQKALDHFTRALELQEKLGDRGNQAWILYYLGVTSLHLGDADQALKHYNASLQIYRETGGMAWQGYVLRDIGWAHQMLGEPRVALEHYARALEIGNETGIRLIEAAALHGMGRAHLDLGEPGEAARLFERTLDFYRETQDALGELSALLELGRAFQALHDEKRAAESFRLALDLSRQRKTLLTEAVAQAALARLSRDQGDLQEAASAIEEALRIIESIRPKVASQWQRVSFFASRREYYDFYIDVQMRLHERDPAGGHLAAALAASERARSRALLDLLNEGRIDLRRGIDPELKRSEEEVGRRLSLLQGQLLDDLSKDGKHAARIELELDQAEEERERIDGQIQRDYPHYAAFSTPAPLPPEKIQGLLDEHTAFLQYAVGPEHSYLFVVTRDRLEGYRLPGAKELADEVDTLRGLLQEPGRRYFSRYAESAHRLYKTLLGPAEAMLRDKKRLILSPDGPLLLLSFEALLTSPDVPQAGGYESLSYLIRDRSVAYAPSASVFAELGRAPSATPASSEPALSFLGFADPDYGRWADGSASPADAGPIAQSFQRAGLLSLRRLPGSRREVEEATSLYPPEQFRLYVDGEATEENVKDNPYLRHARWIHFAVHGFVNETRPEYSGLVLTLDEDSREDGLLQVHEIFNLELDADLVVLSACETALGKNVKGEGLLGVSRALLYAGAASVVVSLWQVADNATPELMVSFYRQLLQSGDKAEALRVSKLKLIDGGTHAHPYYWAPFILIGQPGSGVTSPQVARQREGGF